MGYYVNITGSSAAMPKTKEAAAYAALVELNKHDEGKTGGRWGPNGLEERWFAWMPPNYPEECPTVRAILECLDFDCREDEEFVYIDYYNSKTGNEDVFIKALAPFLTGHMAWRGEEGEEWMWEFTPGKPPRYYVGVRTWQEADLPKFV